MRSAASLLPDVKRVTPIAVSIGSSGGRVELSCPPRVRRRLHDDAGEPRVVAARGERPFDGLLNLLLDERIEPFDLDVHEGQTSEDQLRHR
jgi:hypothetical protein